MPYTERYFQYKMMEYEILAVRLFQKIANWFYNKQQERGDRK